MQNQFKGELKTETSDSESKGSTLCHICADTATGRHYGAVACNGCKGFFRRTVRRAYDYHCRFSANCEISKHNRAVCRYCRYMKCISSGMRDDQVQSERDVIGKREKKESKDNMKSFCNNTSRPTSPESNSNPTNTDAQNNEHDNLLERLIKSEMTIQSLRDTVITQTGNVEYTSNKKYGIHDGPASLNDVLKSMHSQLLLVIEWAKTLPEFTQLSPNDQAILLKNFAGQHVTLCVAYRSVGTNDVLKLLNDMYIPRASKTDENTKEFMDGFYLQDCEKVMDELVEPMKFLNLDHKEFVAIKACVFFNPVAPGLSREAFPMILEARRKIFAALQHYIKCNKFDDGTRVGDMMFFLLSPLSVLSKTISEDVMFTKVSGTARIDLLMQELILADNDHTSKPDPPRRVMNRGSDVHQTSHVIMNPHVESTSEKHISQHSSLSPDVLPTNPVLMMDSDQIPHLCNDQMLCPSTSASTVPISFQNPQQSTPIYNETLPNGHPNAPYPAAGNPYPTQFSENSDQYNYTFNPLYSSFDPPFR